MPMDTGSMVVAVTLPSSQFLPEQTYVINSAGEALSGHNIQLNFSDVHPAAMLRRVMDFQFLAILRASGAGNALYSEESAWVLRLSITRIILSRSG